MTQPLLTRFPLRAVRNRHVGRTSHSSYQPGGRRALAPSAVRIAEGKCLMADGTPADFEEPREATEEEILEAIEQYGVAAANAMRAGFDGVEVHGANGYLIDQFLHDGSNTRKDRWGGPVENRARFLDLVVRRVISAVGGSGRVGVRLSPWGTFNGVTDSDVNVLFTHALRVLAPLKLAYLHLVEPRVNGNQDTAQRDDERAIPALRAAAGYDGPIISAGGYTRERAIAAVREGRADAVAFGRLFISNPDLVERLRNDWPLAPYNRATFYTRGPEGYTDYPTFKPQDKL